MCTHYTPSRADHIAYFEATGHDLDDWHRETWPDYSAPIIMHGTSGNREVVLGSYGLMPKSKLPPGVRFTTVNARSETIGELRTYAKPWREGKLCLVPMEDFFEPCYESGKAVNWRIGLQDASDFAVAGLFKEWPEAEGKIGYSFTQITINADDHPVMRRFHKPGDEKRSLVILRPEDWDDWLSCKNPEFARSFLLPCPPELMRTEAAPLPPRTKKPKAKEPDLLG
ncbi:SOS response-associated peptidase [Undibacterium sp. Di26W]|uniref:SOS response-associated peptidase n=1 Tax=Undibacterium sp. Di26W TaxID=3413035 RepID=UPI003BF066DA